MNDVQTRKARLCIFALY